MSLVEHWDNYEDFPKTHYVNGDKKFSEIKKDDILYCLTEDNKLIEVKVTNPLHESRDYHYVITYNNNKTINFGQTSCGNVRDVEFTSIADFYRYNGCLIYGARFAVVGTNKETVIQYQLRRYYEKVNELKNNIIDCNDVIAKLKNQLCNY